VKNDGHRIGGAFARAAAFFLPTLRVCRTRRQRGKKFEPPESMRSAPSFTLPLRCRNLRTSSTLAAAILSSVLAMRAPTNLRRLFERAGVACRISENIDGELWTKLIWNCALNAISALGRAKYGQIAASEDARKVVETVVNEVLAVAAAARHPNFRAWKIASRTGRRSQNRHANVRRDFVHGQDLMRGSGTEIDSLNGYISRRGADLAFPTPVNHALFTL